ncbi:MAG: hypothetical protein R3F37_12115 [Candidatus Competibacteraceae bacterium]
MKLSVDGFCCRGYWNVRRNSVAFGAGILAKVEGANKSWWLRKGALITALYCSTPIVLFCGYHRRTAPLKAEQRSFCEGARATVLDTVDEARLRFDWEFRRAVPGGCKRQSRRYWHSL